MLGLTKNDKTCKEIRKCNSHGVKNSQQKLFLREFSSWTRLTRISKQLLKGVQEDEEREEKIVGEGGEKN